MKEKQVLTSEEIRRIQAARWRARTDLRWLCNEILGYKDVSDKIHGPLLSRLQQFPRPTKQQFEENDVFKDGKWRYRPNIPMLQLQGRRRLLILDSRGCLKCACDNTEVRTNAGVYKRAADIKVGEILYGIDEDTFEPREVRVTGIEEQPPQQSYRIRFRSGREIEVSHEHPLKTIDGWLKAADVKIGDFIASLGEAPEPENAPYLPEAEILGWYIGDGSFSNSVVTNNSADFRQKIIQATIRAGGDATEAFPKDRCPCVRTRGLRDLFRSHGVQETTSGDKFVPEAVFRANNKSVQEFLYAYLMCDGTLKRGGISYTTKSKRLVKDIQRLFLRFGIQVTIRPATLKTGPYAGNTYWVGYIQSSKQVRKALNLFSWDKKHSWPGDSKFSNPNTDLVPKLWRKLYPKYFFARGTKPEWLTQKWGHWDGYRIVGKSLSSYRGRKEYLRDLGIALNDRRLQNLGSAKINWEEVVEVIDLGFQRTWAIETDNHTYAIDDIVTHNTTINAISHTIQWIINYPDIAAAILQANLDKAADILSEIKNHFTRNEKFRALFPEHCPEARRADKFGTQYEFTTEARNFNVTRKEPTVRAASIEKGLAGSHFDLMKYSDIVDENNSNNPEICKTIFDKFVLSQNLLVSPIYWIDVEGTRYAETDTYGEIIRGQELVLPEKRTWNIFVRGIFEKDTGGKPREYTYAEVKLPDKLDESGLPISIWPDRFPASGILEEFAMNSFLTSCQKYNFPNAAAGGQTVFPVNDKYPAWKSREDFTQRVSVAYYEIRVDTAETVNERSNHSVITVGAWDNAGRLYIVDIRRGKWLAAELIAQVVAAHNTYRDKSRNGYVRVCIEETAYVRGLMLGFKQYLQQRGLYIPIETYKTDNTKSKVEKIVKTLQYPYLTKQIIFLDDLKEKEALKQELEGMPKPLTDDILDTLAAFYTGKEWLGRVNDRAEPGNVNQLMENRLSPAQAARERAAARLLGFSEDLDANSPTAPMDPTLAQTGGL